MINADIMKSAERLCDELGAVVIVREHVTVAAKKLVNGEWYGDYVTIDDDEIQDGSWVKSVEQLKRRVQRMFDAAEARGRKEAEA